MDPEIFRNGYKTTLESLSLTDLYKEDNRLSKIHAFWEGLGNANAQLRLIELKQSCIEEVLVSKYGGKG